MLMFIFKDPNILLSLWICRNILLPGLETNLMMLHHHHHGLSRKLSRSRLPGRVRLSVAIRLTVYLPTPCDSASTMYVRVVHVTSSPAHGPYVLQFVACMSPFLPFLAIPAFLAGSSHRSSA